MVEWPSAARAELEAAAHKGVVVVRYEGCEMQVLRDCRAPARYGYVGVTRKHDRIRIRDADELYANLPVYAAHFEGELAKAGELAVDMTIVGRYETSAPAIDESQLSGRCAGATHVLGGLTIGAFEFYTNAESNHKAGAGALGVGVGTQSSQGKETLNEDGDRVRCDQSTGSDAAPPDGCGAILRVEAVPLGRTRASRPTCPSATEWDGSACVAKSNPSKPTRPSKTRSPVPSRVVTKFEKAVCPAGTKLGGSVCLPGSMTPCSKGKHLVLGGMCEDDRPPPALVDNLHATKQRGMVSVPGATYLFGSYEGRDKPHQVTVGLFSIDATEVSVGDYVRCMVAGACPVTTRGNYCNFGDPQRTDYPMNCVPVSAAESYCAWQGKRLPTSEEWELAARGAAGRRYAWGNQEAQRDLCWKRGGVEKACPVGFHPDDRTPTGIYDMAANVMEWTSSMYCKYGRESCSDGMSIYRGGAFESSELMHVVATSWSYTANPTQADIGFRCAR